LSKKRKNAKILSKIYPKFMPS